MDERPSRETIGGAAGGHPARPTRTHRRDHWGKLRVTQAVRSWGPPLKTPKPRLCVPVRSGSGFGPATLGQILDREAEAQVRAAVEVGE